MERADGRLEEVRDRRAKLRETLVDLENALSLAAGRPEQWSSAVAETLGRLVEALERHVTMTERHDGLFAQVLDESPRLAAKVERLRTDHDDLRDDTADLIGRCGTVTDEDAVQTVRSDALDLINALARHRQHGADLLYEAYEVDIAASD